MLDIGTTDNKNEKIIKKLVNFLRDECFKMYPNINYNVVYRWDYDSNTQYRPLSGGKLADIDPWRDFRVIQIGSNNDYVIGAERKWISGIQVPLEVGPWEIGVWNQDAFPINFSLALLKEQLGDHRYPDWTIVEHISPY